MNIAKALFCSMLLASALFAENIGPPWGYVRSADVVFIGDIVGGTAVDLGSRIACKATVQVERFIKGDGAIGSEFTLSWEYEPYGMMPPEEARSVPRAHGLWMLRRAEDGTFMPFQAALQDRNLGGVYLRLPEIPVNAKLAYAADDSPEVKLAAELGSALQFAAENEGSNLNVDWKLPRFLGENNPILHAQRDFQDLMQALEASGPAAAAPVYRYFLELTLPNLRAIGIRGVLRSGDTDAVFLLEKEAASFDNTLGISALVASVWHLPLDKNLPAAHALARVAVGETEFSQLEASAASMLGELKRPEFLPYLAVILDSPVLGSRCAAVLAFCDAVRPSRGQDPQMAGFWRPEFSEYCPVGAPIIDPVVERKDVLFWKQWWAGQREQFESEDSFPRPMPPARYSTANRREVEREIRVELRFDGFVSTISSFRQIGPIPPSDLPRTPSERGLLLPCLSAGDDQTVDQTAGRVFSSMEASTTKLRSTMDAYRVQGKPQDEELLQAIEEERAVIARKGMQDLRQALSPDGWQVVERLIMDGVALNTCRGGKLPREAGL